MTRASDYAVGSHVIVVASGLGLFGERGHVQAIDGRKLWVLPVGRTIPHGADPREYCLRLYAHEVALIER